MSKFEAFFESESSGGAVLFLMAVLGVVLANTPFAGQYFGLLQWNIGPFSVLNWINDALMAIFFLSVGLELKREGISGELNTNAKRFLPGICAFFGVVTPAFIYYLIAGQNLEFAHGWAIPTATDIAFAIGVIALLGNRVPRSMKVFLTALAVIDDLMAILVIALFYSQGLNWDFLGYAALITCGLIYINKRGYVRPMPYLVLGLALWYCILKSGLHATMAGVILAMCIPEKGIANTPDKGRHHVYPLQKWDHALRYYVSFLIIPLFGFANAGVSFSDFSVSDLMHPVIIATACGLFFGKQIGIFTSLFFLVKSGIVPKPKDASWFQIYGVCVVCGVGFTMALFVSLLSFAPGLAQERAKVGIFIGSICAGLVGYILLRIGSRTVTLKHRDA